MKIRSDWIKNSSVTFKHSSDPGPEKRIDAPRRDEERDSCSFAAAPADEVWDTFEKYLSDDEDDDWKDEDEDFPDSDDDEKWAKKK